MSHGDTLKQAISAFQSGQYEASLKGLTTAIHHAEAHHHQGDDPQRQAHLLSNRAAVYIKLGRHTEALKDAHKATQLLYSFVRVKFLSHINVKTGVVL